MSDVESPQSIPPEIDLKAKRIVDRAINNKGQVASLSSAVGNIRSFEDTISETIWNQYVEVAMREVDAGRWEEAHVVARTTAIGKTINTLMNQGL